MKKLVSIIIILILCAFSTSLISSEKVKKETAQKQNEHTAVSAPSVTPAAVLPPKKTSAKNIPQVAVQPKPKASDAKPIKQGKKPPPEVKISKILKKPTKVIHQSTFPNEQRIVNAIEKQTTQLDPKVLRLALRAYDRAEVKHLDKQHILTIVDFSMPSSKERLWVIDLNHNKVLYHLLVAHGKNSGKLYARHFSNNFNTLESSIGLFETKQAYVGSLGYSLRLKGLTPGYNNNAYRRDVVVHGAWYVSPWVVKRYGYLGLTWGCFGLNSKINRPVINKIKDGTLLFAYYPDKKWLTTSPWLKESIS